jgi:hypothetical protein
MMTRKDYIATSNILNRFYKETVSTQQEESFDALVHDFADIFEADNDRFMRGRFVDACYEV